MSDADIRFHLAKAWARRSRTVHAVAGFRQVLALDPTHVGAHVELGHALLKLAHIDEALSHYAQVLALAPDNVEARVRFNFLTEALRRNTNGPSLSPPLENYAHGKINLNHQRTFSHHRSGWSYGLRALKPLHNEQGVLFDGCIEENFARQHWQAGIRDAAILEELKRRGLFQALATSEEQGRVPYTQPWLGVVHNPPNLPAWFHSHEAPQNIFAREIWKKSAESCRGLFTSSRFTAEWLRQSTRLPVDVFTFPTEVPERTFEVEQFLANPRKKIIQVGWWLRQLSAIHRLPLASDNPLGYEKIRLVPNFFGDAEAYLSALLAHELTQTKCRIEPRYGDNTRTLPHVTDQAYDKLLSENIAFAFLYDANANNLVVECIARATPLLINRLPAVVEYLGVNYPLYVGNLDEAAAKALDVDLIVQAHEYLKQLPTRYKLTSQCFLESIRTSAIYQSL
jgi:tetratricopeptide (TPR) repeat protein